MSMLDELGKETGLRLQEKPHITPMTYAYLSERHGHEVVARTYAVPYWGDGPPAPPDASQGEAERFWRFVSIDRSTGCWVWKGGTTTRGYGRFHRGRFAGREVKAYPHRWAYEAFFGKIPDGHQIDHIVCENVKCCNPLHLVPATPRDNTLRGENNVASINARKEACVNGHPFDEANTYYRSNGARECRTCGREGERKRRKLRKEQR